MVRPTIARRPGRRRASIPVVLHRGIEDDQAEGHIVRAYLEALRSSRRSGRHTIDSINRRLSEIKRELIVSDALSELKLVEERRMLREAKSALSSRAVIEAAFIEVAKSYSIRHGIAYATWQEVGVPAVLLRRAGLRPDDHVDH